MILGLLTSLLFASTNAMAGPVASDETPIACDNCAEWNQPQTPFRIFGNTYYVGTHGLSSVLIVTKNGLILLDGDLPQSVQQIAANIKTLGFDVHDVRLILNSHVHFDHAGGIAALQRISGANVGASALGAAALSVGVVPADDPQSDSGKATRFPPVPHVQALLDGETISLGDTTVTAHYTPGHTPGGTTWTWSSCDSIRCVNVIYADSLNPVSAPGFRFSDPSRHPTAAETLRRGIGVVRALSCNVLITVHPDFSGVLDRAAANARDPSKNAFLDSLACGAYADDADKRLDARLKEESGNAAH
ncbi:MAG TPA: subclass B3 metallo-beta-lactamase [Xanthomonadaceae bacterium]|nr:subclass B3 metallo-beta-lactamase [Xanthomonadaceae bacterium]